jgi:hypothetical protein
MKKNSILVAYLLGAIISLGYGFSCQAMIRTESMKEFGMVMSFGFVFLFPFCLGAATVYFAGESQRKSILFQILMPAFVSTISLFLSMIAGMEGTICLVLALPIYWVLSILGGLTTGFVLGRMNNKNLQMISFGFLLFTPFLSGTMERYIPLPQEKRIVDTQIRIQASAPVIWSQIARIPKITEEQNGFFYFMGFPRPVEATLSHEGVGGVREAIFEKGLEFLETITVWEENKVLQFSIKSQPEKTPLTTLDSHVVVGGEYFDTLTGKYEIEPISENESILHLQSRYRISTRFNFYASYWADFLMSDIQNNILRVLKSRAENIAKKNSQN